MQKVVRKVSRGRWPDSPPPSRDSLWADSVTGSCLKTSSNELSVWRIEPENWKEAVLAIGCKFQSLDTFDLVWLDESALVEKLLLFSDTQGETFIEELKTKHADIVGLNYETLGALAMHTANQICDPRFYRRVLGREVKEILLEAVNAGRLDAGKLHDGVRKKLGVN